MNYFSYRKKQISFIVLCDQIFYFQTLWGLLETVIGVNLDSITDGYRPRFQEEMDESFSEIGGITSIPSIVMLAITIRLGVFWLLNILLLICVLISVCRLPHKKGKVSV